jgi:nicotinamide-nucleotide amidase
MRELMPAAEQVAAKLFEKKHTIAIAESSAGGLISAALLAVPGASKYFMGGAVVYTRHARRNLLGLEGLAPGLRSSTEPYVLIHANRIREQFDTTWGFAEAGAAGPPNDKGLGNGYGDAAGHSCFAVVGKVGFAVTERTTTLETGKPDRLDNMLAFANEGLKFLLQEVSR